MNLEKRVVRRRPHLLPLVLLLIGPLAGIAQPAQAYSRAEVPPGTGIYLSWAQRAFFYALNQDGCPGLPLAQVEQALVAAFASWSTPDCTDITFTSLGTTASQQTNLTLGQGQAPDGQSLLVWRQDSWPPAGVTDGMVTAEMPAVTTVLFDPETGEIFDADIDLNGVHFSWGVLSAGSATAFADVQSVIAHEVGHLLGLGHSADAQATLYPTLTAGETKKRTLEPDDLAGLCFVYPAGQPTPPGPGASDPPHAEEEGGCALAAARLGGDSGPPTALALLLLLGAAYPAAHRWRLAKAATWR